MNDEWTWEEEMKRGPKSAERAQNPEGRLRWVCLEPPGRQSKDRKKFIIMVLLAPMC